MIRPPCRGAVHGESVSVVPLSAPGFVGAVELEHLGACALLERRRPGIGNGFASGEHDAKRRQVQPRPGGGVQHHDELGTHAGQHRYPVGGHGEEHLSRPRIGGDDGRTAEHARREVRRPQPEPEGSRHGAEEDVVGRELPACTAN